MLMHDEAMALSSHKDYTGKLDLLSRISGYSDDIERSFLGKNLVNTLSALAERHKHLEPHHITSKADHPDGLGALKFYALRMGPTIPREFRGYFLRGLQDVWPTAISIDNMPAVSLRIGHNAAKEVDDEMVQFFACAMQSCVWTWFLPFPMVFPIFLCQDSES